MTLSTPHPLRSRCALIFAILLLPLAGTGCSDLLKQPYPAKAYFGLEPGVPSDQIGLVPATTLQSDIHSETNVIATTRPITKDVMLVHPVKVVPPYDGVAFIYRDGPAKFETDYYANWIASPSALLTGGLKQWLDGAGGLPVIVTNFSGSDALSLEGEVTRLLIDRTDRTHPQAELEAHFLLARENHEGATVLFDASYTAKVLVTDDTSTGYAIAWGLAYRQLLHRLTDDLRLTLSRSG